MDYTLKEHSISTATTLLDTVVQQVVDTDLTLPDYCPDIQKILKCTMKPKIFTKNIMGGQLQVDGTTEIKIIYCDGIKSHFRVCEQMIPFSVTLPIKNLTDNFISFVNTKVEYINCRALSPRKLVIRGAFSLYAKIISKKETMLYSPSDEANLQTKTTPIEVMDIVAFSQDELPINEQIVLSNKPSIESILKTSLEISSIEYKTIPSKLLINGELNLKMLYLADLDTGALQNIDYILPFSHIIASDGLNEDVITNVKGEISNYEVRFRPDSNDSNPEITLDAKINFTVVGYNKINLDIIEDAFSNKCQTDINFSKQTLLKDINSVKETIMHKASINTDGIDLNEVIEVSNESCNVTTAISDDSVSVNGKMNISIFAKDSEGIPLYIERMVEFNHKISSNSLYNNVEDITATVGSISYRLADNKGIELRCEIKLKATLANSEFCNFVSSVTENEDMQYSKSKAALTIYFAHKGESVWNISKSYHSNYQAMLEENDIKSEFLTEAKTLLIPLI